MELNMYIIIILLIIFSIFCGCNYSLGTSKICIGTGLMYMFIISIYWRKNNYKIENFDTTYTIANWSLSNFKASDTDNRFVDINKDKDIDNVTVKLVLNTNDSIVTTECEYVDPSKITIKLFDNPNIEIMNPGQILTDTIPGTESSEYSIYS